MRELFSARLPLLWLLTLAAGHPAPLAAAPPPDPCKLITVAELEPIVGKLKGGPKPGDARAGDISCEFTTAKDAAWIQIRLHEGSFDIMKRSFGGKTPQPVPELGADAFVNGSYEGFSAELFARKGPLVLRVSMPKGPASVDAIKAIARKALPRL
jgi:hypothetical protein